MRSVDLIYVDPTIEIQLMRSNWWDPIDEIQSMTSLKMIHYVIEAENAPVTEEWRTV